MRIALSCKSSRSGLWSRCTSTHTRCEEPCRGRLRDMLSSYTQIRGRNDTLKDNATVGKGPNMSKIAVRRALKGLRNAAQTTTT